MILVVTSQALIRFSSELTIIDGDIHFMEVLNSVGSLWMYLSSSFDVLAYFLVSGCDRILLLFYWLFGSFTGFPGYGKI